jgi:hypothetical protein
MPGVGLSLITSEVVMINFWKCPHCGSRNEKRPRQGPIVEHLGGGKILYQTFHPDNCPKCEGQVSGGAILSGQYDDYSANWRSDLLQPFVGLMFLLWFFGAFWVIPFAFNKSKLLGIACLLIWASPLLLVFSRR